MEKIKIEDIPEALTKWADKREDFWIISFIRSLGYTFDELVHLSKKNKEILKALITVSDSLYEKAVYKVAEGYMSIELAESVYANFKKRLKSLTNKKIIVDLSLDNGSNMRFNRNKN